LDINANISVAFVKYLAYYMPKHSFDTVFGKWRTSTMESNIGRSAIEGPNSFRLASICIFALLFCAFTARPSSQATDMIVMLDMSMDSRDANAVNLPSAESIRILSGGARVAAAEIQPGDRVSLVTFSDKAKIVVPMTNDVRKFESALRKTGSWIAQKYHRHLYDALLTALNTFPVSAPSDTRRCILVFTSASDLASKHTADEVAAAAKSKHTAIFIALISPPLVPPHIMPGGHVYPRGAPSDKNEDRKTLAPLAWQTGGDIGVYPASPYVVASVIRDMVNR
jgi:hypothetical protein